MKCSTNGSPSTVKDTTLCESQSLVALDDLVSQDCYIACPDECVLESWSEWSPCDRDCSEQRKRTRRILRQDTNLQCNDTELIQVGNLKKIRILKAVNSDSRLFHYKLHKNYTSLGAMEFLSVQQ